MCASATSTRCARAPVGRRTQRWRGAHLHLHLHLHLNAQGTRRVSPVWNAKGTRRVCPVWNAQGTRRSQLPCPLREKPCVRSIKRSWPAPSACSCSLSQCVCPVVIPTVWPVSRPWPRDSINTTALNASRSTEEPMPWWRTWKCAASLKPIKQLLKVTTPMQTNHV